MSTRQRVLEQYPSLAFLLNDPEVGKLLIEAVDPYKGFSPQTFRAKLYETKWWKSRSETARQWAVMKRTDPGTARQRRSAYDMQVRQAAARYGIQLSTNVRKFLVELGLQNGHDPDGPEMLLAFQKVAATSKKVPGAIHTNAQAIKEMANRDWMVVMPDSRAEHWADRIARGFMTMDDMRTQFAKKAAQLYPQFADGIKRGFTVGELVDDYVQIIARELEVDPDRIGWSDPKFRAILEWKGEDGKPALPTYTDAIRLARQDPKWWETSGGRQHDAQYARALTQIFGRRGRLMS